MKEFLTVKVVLEDALSLKEMLSLHHFSKDYRGMIYILCNHKLVNFNNLPKLVSFLLTCKNIVAEIVVEGPNPEQVLIEIHNFFKPNNFRNTRLLSPMA